MRRIACTLLLSLLPLTGAAVASADPAPLLIHDVRVVDPATATVGERVDVLVEDGRIAAVAPGLKARHPDVAVVDGAGAFAVPGLIDSHVHVGHVMGLADEHHDSRPELVRAYRRQLPRSYLFFGFTTLIDPDLRSQSREELARAEAAPELLGCGRGIRLFDGYGFSFVPAEARLRVFPNWVFNPDQASGLPAGVDPAAHTPAAAVAQARADGAVCVKTYHEPGFGGAFDWPVPTPELLAAVVAEAHRHRLPVLLHATSEESWRAGLAAGVDVLAHGVWHWPGDRLRSELPPSLVSLLAEVAKSEVAVQPTARVIFGEAESWDGSTLSHPRIGDALPKVLLDWLATEEGKWSERELQDLYARKSPNPETPPERFLAAMNDRVKNALAAYQRLGVKLIFGSDTPAQDGVGNPPGLNGLLEINAWAAAGIPPARILAALTVDNARRFGLDTRLGRIAPGMEADLLLLTGDPLAGVDAWDTIRWVVVDGRPIDRATLSARRLVPE